MNESTPSDRVARALAQLGAALLAALRGALGLEVARRPAPCPVSAPLRRRPRGARRGA